MYINPAKMPYLIAEKLQIDPQLLNKPEMVAQVMQGFQQQMMQANIQAQQQGEEVTPQQMLGA